MEIDELIQKRNELIKEADAFRTHYYTSKPSLLSQCVDLNIWDKKMLELKRLNRRITLLKADLNIWAKKILHQGY